MVRMERDMLIHKLQDSFNAEKEQLAEQIIKNKLDESNQKV